MHSRFGYFTRPHPGIYYMSGSKRMGIKLDPSDINWSTVKPFEKLGHIEDEFNLEITDVNKFVSAVLLLIDILSAYDLTNIPNLTRIMLLILSRAMNLDIVKIDIPKSYNLIDAAVTFSDLDIKRKIEQESYIYDIACHEIVCFLTKRENVISELRMITENKDHWLHPSFFDKNETDRSLSDNIWFYLIGPKNSGYDFDERFLKKLGCNLSSYLWSEESTKMIHVYTKDLLCLYAVRQLFTDECIHKILFMLKSKMYDPNTNLFIQGQVWLNTTWSGIYSGITSFGSPILLNSKTVQMPPETISGYYLLSCQDHIWAILSLGVVVLENIIAKLNIIDFWKILRHCFGRFNEGKLCGFGYNNLINNIISMDNTLAALLAAKLIVKHYSFIRSYSDLTLLKNDICDLEDYVESRSVPRQCNVVAETGFGKIVYPLVNISTTAWLNFYNFDHNPFSLVE